MNKKLFQGENIRQLSVDNILIIQGKEQLSTRNVEA